MTKQIILFSLLGIILLPKPVFAGAGVVGDNTKLKLMAVEQKLQIKIEEVFASTPKLAVIYHKIQNSELGQMQELSEYNDLLASKELKILNNSREMQESLKEVMRDVNIKIEAINKNVEAINAQTKQLENMLKDQNLLENKRLSPKEIKEKINLNNITSSELKKQINSITQSLSSLSQLYFTDTKALSSLSELTPIQKPDTITTDGLLVSIANLNQLIDTRINDMLPETLGIAASGEEVYAEQGLWVKGLKSYAKQSEYSLTPEYQITQHGVAIGMDFIDDFLLGISYLFTTDLISTNIPNTKEKINSHVANVYGLYKYTDNLFIDIQAKYGKSYIKKSRNNLNLSNDISYAKTTGNIYGGKVELGYTYYMQEKLHIIPSVGVSYDELQIDGYKETGEGFNRRIDKRTVNKTAALFGLKLSNYIKTSSYTLVPEIHAKAFQTLSTDNAKTVITIFEGMPPLVTDSGKLPKTIYRIGGSAKITRSPALELELGYDVGISKKFYFHTGYISARVGF